MKMKSKQAKPYRRVVLGPVSVARRARGAMWFAEMRQAVDNAMDWKAETVTSDEGRVTSKDPGLRQDLQD